MKILVLVPEFSHTGQATTTMGISVASDDEDSAWVGLNSLPNIEYQESSFMAAINKKKEKDQKVKLQIKVEQSGMVPDRPGATTIWSCIRRHLMRHHGFRRLTNVAPRNFGARELESQMKELHIIGNKKGTAAKRHDW